MKKLVAIVTMFCLLLNVLAGTVYGQTTSTSKKPPLTMQILGKKTSTKDGPVLKSSIIYIPLSSVGKSLGYNTFWNSKTKVAEIKTKTHMSRVTIGNAYGIIDNKTVKMNAAAILYNGRAYAPLDFIQKSLQYGYTTTYDQAKNIVTINKTTASPAPTSAPATKTNTKAPAAPAPAKPQEANAKSIYILDKKADAGYAPLVKNNKVYVPLRPIGEGLKYAVTYSTKTKVMTLKKTGHALSITIGKTEGYENGKKIKINEAPFLSGGRAYVSLDLIQSHFNYDTVYDKAKNTLWINSKTVINPPSTGRGGEIERIEGTTIDDIKYDESGGFPELGIIASGPVEYTSFTMSNPERMVIDIPDTQMNTDFEVKEIGKGGVQRARIAQFSESPKIVRIVIDLTDQKACKLVQSDDKKTISLIYANIIEPISVTQEGEKDVITIKGTTDLDTSVIALQNPDRLVLDVKRAVLGSGEQTIEVNSPRIQSARTGQFEVGTARVVLDLKMPVFYDIKTTGNTAKLYISDIPFNFMEYQKYYNSALITLSPGTQVEYHASVDPATNTLNITVQQDLKIEEKIYPINDNLLESVQIKKESREGILFTTASFKMKDKIEYELLSPAVTNLIKLKFKSKALSTDQLTIVIDPGHGGKDPGAVAKDGTKEKDLNLHVALLLDKKLKALGFKTIMTRTDDTYVDLATRTNLANNNYADFFMSIHFNAFNQSTKGIETLYFPNTPTAEYPIENRAVAQIFHKELLQSLQRSSRGITPRPNLYVLNKTKMPAILAELGFMTNTEELSQIKTDAYKEKAAKALAVSIVKYFKDIQGTDLGIDTQAIYKDPIAKAPTQFVTKQAATVKVIIPAPPIDAVPIDNKSSSIL